MSAIGCTSRYRMSRSGCLQELQEPPLRQLNPNLTGMHLILISLLYAVQFCNSLDVCKFCTFLAGLSNHLLFCPIMLPYQGFRHRVYEFVSFVLEDNMRTYNSHILYKQTCESPSITLSLHFVLSVLVVAGEFTFEMVVSRSLFSEYR